MQEGYSTPFKAITCPTSFSSSFLRIPPIPWRSSASSSKAVTFSEFGSLDHVSTGPGDPVGFLSPGHRWKPMHSGAVEKKLPKKRGETGVTKLDDFYIP